MKNVPFIFFLPLWIFLPSITFAADFQAKVIHIADGDTITVLNETNEQIKIRLNGIDCPEKAQAYGNKAKQFTKNLVGGQTVTIQAYDQDRYGRTIGDVVLENGRNLSQELVKAGYAWWFFKYSDDEQLGLLEVQAKIAKVGLWADKNPVPPWIFGIKANWPPFNLRNLNQALLPPRNFSTPSPYSEINEARNIIGLIAQAMN